MTAKTLVDCEGPIRAWARAQSLAVGDRVFIGIPTHTVDEAFIGMGLVDGGVQPGEAPLASALIQFDSWAPTRAEASANAWELATAIESMPGGTVLDETLVGLNGQVITGPIFQPDPDGKPRYRVDAAFTVRVP